MTKTYFSNKYTLRIKQALDGNFILLYQPAPNSFIIIQKNEVITCHNKSNNNVNQQNEQYALQHHDNLDAFSVHTNDSQLKCLSRRQRRQRFRVVIGPQLCNCQNEIKHETGMIIKSTEPCIHLLFVMLHVLKIPSDDQHLTSVPLPSSKAEFWIENYRNHRQSIVHSYAKNRKSSNTLKSDENQPETLKFFDKSLNNDMSSNRLIIPQPIRHGQTGGFLHLRTIINPSAHDSTELSSITQDIIPVSRRETESAGTCDPSTSYTTATSRTSSIDSIESCKLDSSCRSNDQHRQTHNHTALSNSCNPETALSCRRPRTAPQPELPPRLSRTRALFVRHSASSTTFRPMRDCSPLIVREGWLTPIESEENSTNNSLKYRTPMIAINKNNSAVISEVYTDNYDKLQEPIISTVSTITNKLSHSATATEFHFDPTSKSNFTHARRSSFKPITSVKQKSLFNNTPINPPINTNNQTSMAVNHANNYNDLPPVIKQYNCPPSLQQNGTTITSLNNATLLDDSAKICALCLGDCHIVVSDNTSTNNNNILDRNHLTLDDDDNNNNSNNNLVDSTLVCQSILSDYDDDDNNNINGGKLICGAVFHTSCCKIWLDEIQSDGDSPQCPLCGCVWIHIPDFDKDVTCDKSDDFDKSSDHAKCICSSSSSEQIDSQQTDTSDQQAKTNQHNQFHRHHSLHRHDNRDEQQQTDGTLCCHNQLMHVNADLNVTGNMTILNTLLTELQFSEYNSCVSAFSLEIANALISYDWTVRQYALQQATHLTIRQVILSRQNHLQSVHNNVEYSLNHHNLIDVTSEPNCVKIMFKLIQYLLDDPVDAIFIDALRAFRELLGYLICYNKETQSTLQKAIGPILRRLLRFVGGSSSLWNLRNSESFLPLTYQQNNGENKTHTNSNITNNSSHLHGNRSDLMNENNLTRKMNELSIIQPKSKSSLPIPADVNFRDRSNLALATLIELAKGQSGALALGREVQSESQCLPVSGIQHMVRFVLSSAKFHATHLVGRLTVVDKLICMHQTRILLMQNQSTCHESLLSNDFSNNTKSLARRHLCSTIIFARRHLLPIYPKPDNMTMCFPHHYKLQSTDTLNCNVSSKLPTSLTTATTAVIAAAEAKSTAVAISNQQQQLFLSCNQQQQGLNNVNYCHHTQYKANRIARRVFLTAARALLTWRNEETLDRYDPLPPSKFNANSFIESEINRLDAPLATWFRNRLCLLLYSNDTSKLHENIIHNWNTSLSSNCFPIDDVKQVASTKTEIINVSSFPASNNTNMNKIEKPTRIEEVNSSRNSSNQQQSQQQQARISSHSLDEQSSFANVSSSPPSINLPPIPPPRRLTINNSELTSDDQQQNEPIYTGRSLGSEADLQFEQVTVLRNALTRSTHQPKPLLPIPGLSFVMDSFQQTKKLPNSDEYYESIDWIRGPILGHGAFSQCYQARDVRTGLLLAVKRIPLGRNGLTEVETEVRIMLQLDHPNILRLFGAVHCAKRGFVDLFIEWMPGGSITSLLQQYGAFNESITLNYGIQLIRGLAYLHKHGILHRDLKGANLLIDSTGTVIKISDFGASARLIGEQSVAGQFQGQVIGTFSFMAPEVLRGETYGRACDIWSVGCCLLEMLTSKPPWYDAKLTNRFARMFTIATSNSPPTYPKGLTTDLIAVLDACFARNPSDRPTANQLLAYNAFSRLVSQQSVTSLGEMKVSVQTSPNTAETCKTVDKSLKCQTNSTKFNATSSFNYQRLFKTFQSNKIDSSFSHKKVVVLEEEEGEEDEVGRGGGEYDSRALAISTQFKQIQHPDGHRLQQQHGDDSGLLTRRRKTRRPTLPPINFRRKYRSNTPVLFSSFK
ncbi:hypothetical protein MN116_005619 [Schistosoma mekongi]|uniref:Mitogen-activated protein kinase kinase kinase 1 n=1 Tax=Schistosoma mekongi TaxID=38744 RepID=A0AAE1ZA38_SCHME|nr:hypothetical protein MN116_005619 [Schistosoma mekongi]